MNIKFTKLHPDAVVPTKAHPTDAGFDLTAPEAYVIPANGRALINTGIALDIPLGYFGMVVGRSGNTIRRGLVGQVGIIDSGYYDAIGIMAFNTTNEDISIKAGERVGQLLILAHHPAFFENNSEFSVDNRGGGFGSTGK